LSRDLFGCYNSYRNSIVQFLSLQNNLEHLCFYHSDITKIINETLMKHKNSLRHLEFDDVNFKDEFFAASFYNLKTLSFCVSNNLENVLNPLIMTPLKSLNTLIFNQISVPFEVLSVLIESNSKNLEVIHTGNLRDGCDLILEKISEHCINLKVLSTTMSSILQTEIYLLNNLFKNCTRLKRLELLDENGIAIDIDSILTSIVISPTTELKINGKKIDNFL
jgi:hypothetical protein